MPPSDSRKSGVSDPPMPKGSRRRFQPGLISCLLIALLVIVGGLVAIRFVNTSSNADQVAMPEVSRRGAGDDTTLGSSPDRGGSELPEPLSMTVEELGELPFPQRITQASVDAAEHPFDPLLKVAQTCLATIDDQIRDYQATLSSQVRVDGELLPPRKLIVKIRHTSEDPADRVPFSVYTKFLEPASNAGQEAIWVEGWNEGNLVAHLSGLANLKRFYLDPQSVHAMKGNRYSIDNIGMRNLIVKMSEVAQRDRAYEECEVRIEKGLELDGRSCTLLEAIHPKPRSHFEFHLARIYIDDELELPLGYEGYRWPEQPGGDPVLLEKYFYTDVEINVGLQDIDFDPANESYSYPGW